MNNANHLFSHPVLIKPLGIVVPANYVRGPLRLLYATTNKYELLRGEDMFTSPVIYVRKTNKMTVAVETLLPPEVIALSQSGAQGAYDAVVEQTRRELELEIKQNAAETEVVPVKTRGRRRKVVEEVEEVEETATDDLFEYRLAERLRYEPQPMTFAIEQIDDEDDIVQIESTEAYANVIGRSERNIEVANNKLAQLISYINQLGEKRKALNVDSDELSTPSYVGTLGGDPSTRRLDTVGLDHFRKQLRADADKYENAIRGIYDWFEAKVLVTHQGQSAASTRSFIEDEITLSDGKRYTQLEAVDTMLNEVFVELKDAVEPATASE